MAVSQPDPLLYLTDGTLLSNGQLRRLDLLNPRAGYCLEAWRPQVAQYKQGGYWSDSPLATGRRLTLRRFANAIEVLELKARAHSQDSLIAYQNELLAWLEAAADYWTSRWAASPVYLAARSAYEQNIRYAIVHAGSISELSDPYDQPFLARSRFAALDRLTLRLEHGLWQEQPPGQGTCVPVGNRSLWSFSQWTTMPTPPNGTILSLIEAGDGAFLAGLATSGAVWRSTDGQTWTAYATLGTSGTRNVEKLIRAGSDLYAAVNGSGTAGVYQSADHGATWTRVLATISGVTAGPQYWDITYDAPRNRLLACGGGTIDGLGLRGIVSESKDGGATWRHWWNTAYTYYSSLAVDDAGRVYVGVAGPNGTVLRSTQTWFELTPPPVTWTPTQPDENGRSVTAWFRAEDLAAVGNGNPIQNWYSVVNNIQARSLSHPGQSPTFVANQLNGYPAVRFDGVNDFLDTNTAYPTLTLGPVGFTVVMLVKDSKNNGESITVFGETGSSANAGRYYFELRRTVGQMYLNTNYYRQNINHGYGVDEWHIISIEFLTPGIPRRVYFDGELISTGGSVETATPVTTPAGEGIRIGARGGGGYPFDGDMAELLFFVGGVTAAHRQRVEQYLTAKYNLDNVFYDYEVVGANLAYGAYDMVRVGSDILHSAENTAMGAGNGKIRKIVPTSMAVSTLATLSQLLRVLYADPQNASRIWGGAVGAVWKSENAGLTWSKVTDFPSTSILAFLRTSGGALLAAGTNEMVLLEGGGTIETQQDTAQVGARPACDRSVYVANHSAASNLTHVVVYDASGPMYANYFAGNTYPHELLPAVPAVGDILYIGAQSDLPDTAVGPFTNLVFNLVQPGRDFTAVWEYYNGSAWTTLTTEDKTLGLRNAGIQSVAWRLPSNWSTTAVNGIAAWWVRARVTALGDEPHGPQQGAQEVYSTRWGYVEIEEGVVGGVVPALARIRWHCVSDNPAGAPNIEADRLLVGLRSLSRGEAFSAYLNASDKQTPFGITVNASAPGAFVDSVVAVTGRQLQITSGTTGVWQDVLSWQIANTIARDYYGSYRAFVRVQRTNGDADDVRMRLKVVFGSGGASTVTKDAFVLSATDGELLDLGRVDIPNTSVGNLTDNLGDQLSLVLQTYHAAGSIVTRVYDLVLIPVDEWVIDSYIPALNTTDDSEVDGASYLDIDSLSSPKHVVLAYNRTAGDLIKVRYQANTGGPAVLQAGAAQRLWFLAALYNGVWASYMEQMGLVQVEKAQRYLGLRGDE